MKPKLSVAPLLLFAAPLHLFGTTLNVSNNSSDPTVPSSLPFYIINSAAGDTIDCSNIPAPAIITLGQSFPAIAHSLTITGGTGASVTIDGDGTYTAFSVANGTVSLQNFIVTNAKSIGGSGGDGGASGGGGVGGGPGVYVHNGAQVSLVNMQFTSNTAVGGDGGAIAADTGGGGGGGGFGGGVGGSGGDITMSLYGGGGGGGNANGGAGGAAGAVGGAGTYSGGAGGGGSNAAGGAEGSNSGGTAFGGSGGGGGGAGGTGNNADGTTGGTGGLGIGSNNGYGGGGGGGGGVNANGGSGAGTGGGGGSGTGGSAAGGNGGSSGGGGGGGGPGDGGSGGFGAGGGGSISGTAGVSLYGGGDGNGAAGGGGGALGGAFFIQNGSTLNIGNQFSVSGSMLSAGTGGNEGLERGEDIFLRSGGTLIFSNSTSAIAISTNIDSDEGAGGGTGGGVTVSGGGTVTFSGTNSYSGTTTLSSGTLNVNADAALGSASTPVALSGGTLQAAASFNTSRTMSVSSTGTIDTQAFSLGASGVISGGGTLAKIGSGTLTLSAVNTYTGGTTITAGTLSVAADTALGGSSGIVTLGAGTLQTTASISTARNITLSGAGTIDTQGNTDTFSGVISSSGSLTKAGIGTLILSGTNSYTGGTTISAGLLQGTTSSIQGNIANNSNLVFSQSTSGTYSGTLTGSGSTSFDGGAIYTISGSSPSYTGAISLPSGALIVNGSISGSTLSLSSGTSLSGTGTAGTVTSTGANIYVGNGSIANFTVNGTLTLDSATTTYIAISPDTPSVLVVNNTANLDGALVIQPQSGFYGLSGSQVILTAAPVSGTFASVSANISNFSPSLSYSGTSVTLSYVVPEPFLNFPYDTFNAKSVGNNLDAINSAGTITPELVDVIDTFAGQSNSTINDALNQMHPAQYSAFTELQAEVGGQLISIFHRRPYLPCCCKSNFRLWTEPFGNWLKEKNFQQEVGFQSRTYGVAFGADKEWVDGWVIGIGGAWDQTILHWKDQRGYADTDGLYGSVYTDYQSERFYIGASFLAGKDTYHTHRHMLFTTIDQTASAEFSALDMIAQLATAYFFGTPTALVYPYANVDYLFLRTDTFQERAAPGLNLHVLHNTGQTLRTEVGGALQVQDSNYNRTICISPMLALGWAMECPIGRQEYTSTFPDQTISFKVKGWNHAWQIFSLDFGFSISYKCFLASVRYNAETSAQQHSRYFAQRCNVHLDLKW